MSSLWRIECLTDGRYEYTDSAIEPTVCPVNVLHSVGVIKKIGDTDVITISNAIEIQEEKVATGGHIQMSSRCMEITGSPAIQYMDFTIPVNINVISMAYTSTADHTGDMIEVEIAPNTTIGVIGAPVSVDDVLITVSPTVIENLKLGYWVYLTDGVNFNDLGRCLNINTDTSQITVEEPAINVFSPLSPTYVQMTIKMVHEWHFGPPQSIRLGSDKLGSSFIPANTQVRLAYHNQTGSSKNFIAFSEYLY